MPASICASRCLSSRTRSATIRSNDSCTESRQVAPANLRCAEELAGVDRASYGALMGRYVLIAIVLAVGCKKGGDTGPGSAKAPAAPPVAVTTVVAAEAPTPDVLVLTGTVAADQHSEVTADTQGKVVNVMVERGQRVKFGQPVVQLDVRNAALG